MRPSSRFAAITDLAHRLATAHNTPVKISKETKGYQIYLPCPDCLETHGQRELNDPKYAINASMYFGLGDAFESVRDMGYSGFNPETRERNESASQARDFKSSICMRTRQSGNPHRYSVSALLAMDAITKRHPDIHTSYGVSNGTSAAERESHWEDDPITGILCPPAPGEVVPIIDLPSDHPGRWYLETYRGYNLQHLHEMFRCSFCTKEYPHGKNGIYYRKMPNGWTDTPQGRIIFYGLHNGTPLTWQARHPEWITPDKLNKYFLHPYTLQWDHVATRAAASQAWIPVSPFDQTDENGSFKFSPSKYRTAKYSSRELLGWDAALRRANDDSDPIRWCVVGEGPLDGGRVGPGGIPIIGSSLNMDNAAKLAANFHLVLTAFDNDAAGRAATEKVTQQLYAAKTRNPMLVLVEAINIPEGKDIGEMTNEDAATLVMNTLRRAKRKL